jgi:predicted metalloprotease with PDZ domain
MQRAALENIEQLASRFGHTLDAVLRSPARMRSAEEMSGSHSSSIRRRGAIRPTSRIRICHYTWGAAIGLGLDLSLRARTEHKVTLDDYMRRLWQDFGLPNGPVEGRVAKPYTMQDLRDALSVVSGDRSFANEFFDRYIQGREVVDYQPLLARAGLVLRKSRSGRAWAGPLTLDFGNGPARVSEPTIEDTPVHTAGLDRGDEILSLDGTAISGPGSVEAAVDRRRPGDEVRLSIRRRGVAQTLTVILVEDPRLQLVPAETTGRALTAAERAFRQAWLGSKQ